MTDEEIVESIIQIASSFGISCDDASYIVKSFENFGKEYMMSNIEDDLKAKAFIESYKQIKNGADIIKSIDKDFFFELVDFLLEEREQDKARIKELEEDLYSTNKIINEYLDDIPNQREKEMQAKIKELEAKLEFKKYGDLDEIEFEEYMSHFIPKQKVKDKIEKLKKDYDKKYDLFMGHKFQSKEQQDILKQMRILKELLEEGD